MPTTKTLKRCNRCNDLIVWHNTGTVRNPIWQPRTPGTTDDHRNVCGQPAPQPKLSTSSTCKWCAAPITWIRQESGKYIPMQPSGIDHRERCVELGGEYKARIRTANHEVAVSKFLSSVAHKRRSSKSYNNKGI